MKLDKFDIFYIIGLIGTSVFMIWLLLSETTVLLFSNLIFFWAAKLLSGFGLILTVTTAFLFILDLIADKIGEREVRIFIIIQIIIPVLLVIFGIYRIISSLSPSGTPDTGFAYLMDLGLYIFGIASITLSLYIIPLIKEEFEEAATGGGLFTRIKRGAKKVGRKVKKKYFAFRKQYAKAHIQDQTTLKEILTIWRNKLAVYLLIPIGIGSLVFTPITLICIVFWIKIFITDDDPKVYERIALLISMIFMLFMASLSYVFEWVFYTAIAQYTWTIEIFYLIGIIGSTIIFIYQFAQLKGVTLLDVKEKIGEIRAKNAEE
ncbi:MAG: hypothetical protein GF311_03460 [Candidatus Lokiarchaeota archaeon]|nr:hypothetical protein [Candidatus Lokiarchaeota archaeon]